MTLSLGGKYHSPRRVTVPYGFRARRAAPPKYNPIAPKAITSRSGVGLGFSPFLASASFLMH